MTTKLSAAEIRLFYRLRSEQLRAEAVAATGDPMARASQAPSMKGTLEDQLPGGSREADGKATVALILGKHVAKAKGDPQKPASQSDRLASVKEKVVHNVNPQLKATPPKPKVPAPAPKAEPFPSTPPIVV